MKTIPLSRGRCTLVNDRFYHRLVAMGSWTYNPKGYTQKWHNGTTIQMHRVIWSMAGRPLPRQLDHKDRNGLNNQLGNLRAATPLQNMFNRGPSRRNKCGYKGVCWRPNRHGFEARIMTKDKRKSLGVFGTAKDAAKAYDRAAKKYQGEFAYLNLAT